MEKKIIIDQGHEGERLDKFLAVQIPAFSRTKINRAISAGKILVDDLEKKPSFCLRKGQVVSINFPDAEQPVLRGYAFAVKIIYEDSEIIVVDKPAGLVVHPPQAGYHKTLVNALIYLGKDLAQTDPLRPGVVHRLDKETSGIMVLAKNLSSYKNLIGQFKARKVKKEYCACVWGEVKEEKLEVALPLRRDRANRLKMKVSFSQSKHAYTHIEVAKRLGGVTCLRLMPLTGRMHQLRVHLKFLGYPIAGDKKYGIKDGCKELLLHAQVLSFLHPRTNQLLTFTSPLPERFNAFVCEHSHQL